MKNKILIRILLIILTVPLLVSFDALGKSVLSFREQKIVKEILELSPELNIKEFVKDVSEVFKAIEKASSILTSKEKERKRIKFLEKTRDLLKNTGDFFNSFTNLFSNK